MKRKIDISIVILNYNTRQLLSNCLSSIKNAKKDGLNVETIVVDNASLDDSVNYVKKYFSWVHLVESSQNLGFSAGNNLGAKKAKGEYLLFLNSDTLIVGESLIKMKEFLDNNPEIGAVTPKTLLFNGKIDPDCHRGFPTPWASITYFLGLEKFFPRSRLFGQYHKFYLDLDCVHEIDSGAGAFVFVRKSAFEQIGGWDENYFFYGEDLDLFFRLKQAGWKIMFYPTVMAYHLKGASSGLRKESAHVTKASRDIKLKVAKESIRAMEIFYKKFYRDKYNFLVTMIVILGIKIKGFFRYLYYYFR